MKFKSTFIVIVLFACFYSCSVAQMGLYSSTNKKAIKYYEKAITAFNTINPTTGKSDLNEAEIFLKKAIAKGEMKLWESGNQPSLNKQIDKVWIEKMKLKLNKVFCN